MSNLPEQHANATGPAGDLHRRRDDTRRNLLRANTAVAFILLVVLLLAGAAVALAWRATRLRNEALSQQRRAEQAEAKARADLWRAYVSETRATRVGNMLERRTKALNSIEKAAAISASPELRNEAIATLALPGYDLESSFPLSPAVGKYAFDVPLQRCAIALTNGDVVIHALSDQRELARLRMEDAGIPKIQLYAGGLVFSADGRRLSIRYLGGAIVIWDVETRQIVFRHDDDQQRRLASNAKFTRDGRFIVAPVFTPYDGTAVFDLTTGKQTAFYPEFSSFRHLSIRPNLPMFAANTGEDVTAINWETDERIHFPFPTGVRRIAWSPDGRQLVIVGSMLDVHVWDVATRERRVFTGHKGSIWEIAWDPAGTRVATASEDGTSRIWDLRDNRLVGTTSEGYIFEWSTNDRLGCVRPKESLDVRRLTPSPVYDTHTGASSEADPRTIDISFDGRWAATAARKRGFYFWDLDQSQPATWVPYDEIQSFAFHPTKAQLYVTTPTAATLVSYSVVTNGLNRSIRFEGTNVAYTLRRGRRVDLVSPAPSGTNVAWVELAGGNVWAERTGSVPVRMRGGHHSSVADQSGSARGASTVSISPDGRWLACGFSGGRVEICDATNGQPVKLLSRAEANVQFSASNNLLLVAERGACRVFRAPEWTELWQLPCDPLLTSVAPAAFSPDGKLIAVARSPRSASLLEADTGRELAELEAPAAAPISALRWSQDGQRLVCSLRDNQLGVWKIEPLQRELAALNLHWNAQTNNPPPDAPLVRSPDGRETTAWIAAGALGTASLVSMVAVLSLRRHRRLIHDFTRSEELAARRGRELQDEREVNQLKSSFVSMVSHEFRTPLGIIQSSAQILDRYLDRLPPERRREQLESISRNVRRMAELIDEVLLLGKVEAGRMTFTPSPLNLASFCRRFVDEMTSATHRRCPIELRCEGEFPEAKADENLLRHILGNLVSNASKYSEPGQTVEFSAAREGENVVFTVRDHGIGIPESERSKMFDAFQRASNAAEFQGTGLGLSIAKRCAELHGGRIAFTSEEGKGTTFTVTIPMFKEDGGAREKTT